MDIGRTDGVRGPDRIEGKKVSKPRPTEASSAPSPSETDKVEISQNAKHLSEVLALPESRAEKIEEVRRLIESGQYESDQRLSGALEQFLRDNADLV